MELFYLAGFVFILGGLLFVFKRLKSNDHFDTNGLTIPRTFPDIDPSMYQLRYRVMNNSESSFFHLLQKYLPDGYHVFPKMRIADVVKTKNGKGYYKQRNKILPKHIDFVICDENLKPLCAIEIDGRSHDNPEKQERDELVDYIFNSIHLPLKRVRVGSDFEAIASNLAQKLKQ